MAAVVVRNLSAFRNAEAHLAAALSTSTVHLLLAGYFELPDINNKKLVKELYESGMVSRVTGREIYDLLISRVQGRCPICELSGAVTLDHYLPKAKFPLLCVAMNNLVPSCFVCNHGKLDSVAADADKQALHPYVDSFVNKAQWLHALVDEGFVQFRVATPGSWTQNQARRVHNHAQNHNLLRRYGEDFAHVVPEAKSLLREILHAGGPNAVAQDLLKSARLVGGDRVNSFRRVGYTALSRDAAFCAGGFERW